MLNFQIYCIIIFFLSFFLIILIFSFLASFLGVENPTYLKEGQVDKVLFATAMGGVVVGTLTVVYGLLSMMFGVNKVK